MQKSSGVLRPRGSNTFITTAVSGTGSVIIFVCNFDFLRDRDDGRHFEADSRVYCCREKLKIGVKTGASWSAQCPKVEVVTLSGPEVF